ncbi:MAG: hypothetical protein WCA12_21960 [Burkholderiales bacterium]
MSLRFLFQPASYKLASSFSYSPGNWPQPYSHRLGSTRCVVGKGFAREFSKLVLGSREELRPAAFGFDFFEKYCGKRILF